MQNINFQARLTRSIRLALTAATAILLMPSTASAQTSPDNGATDLDAVRVTAQRPKLFEVEDVNAGALGMRELKDLPFSIGSFTADTVEAQRARTALDVLKNDPSVTPVSSGSSFDGVAVRGFSANAINNARRDGLATNVYMDVPLENKERIDVLKGLSGFLYGVGEPSGVVNYVVKRPTRTRFASVTAEVSEHDGRYVAVDAGGPMAMGGAGYRINAASETRGDFERFGDLKRNFVSAAVDVKLSDSALLQLDADYQKKQLAASALIGPRSDGRVVPADSFDPRTLIGQPWGRYRSEGWNLGGRLDLSLSADWLLTTQLGASGTRRDAAFPDVYEVASNGDVLSGDYYYAPGQRFATQAAQSYLSRRIDSGRIKHDLVTGLSASRLNMRDGGFLVFPETVKNIFSPQRYPRPDLDQSTEKNRTTARQESLFVSDTISFGDHWQVLAGGRYIRYSSDTRFADGSTRRFSVNSTIPTVGLLLKPSDILTLYATYTKGFEQGAYAPVRALNSGQRLDPIESVQYEMGAKWQALPGLLVTGALFDIDKPLQDVDPADNVFKQNGRQRHRGLELAANGAVTDRLSAIVGVAWLDAEQQDTGTAAIDGRRPSNTARFQGNAFLDYRFESVSGLSMSVGYFHVGRRALDRKNLTQVPAYDRWDLGATYAHRMWGKPGVIRLYAENVANRRYWESAVYGGVLQGDPRTLRLSFTLEL